MFSYSNMKLTFSWMVLGLVSRFPIGVEKMEGAVALQNLMGALKSIHGAACEGRGELKVLWKNTCEGVHLIVKLPL